MRLQALVLVPSAVATVYRKGEVASHLFSSLAIELTTLLGSIFLDLGDVVTDIVACLNVLNDHLLHEFHGYYAGLTVLATARKRERLTDAAVTAGSSF